MHHLRAGTYRKYYMPTFFDKDCQAIYFGTCPQNDLVRRVGALRRDSRAPQTLSRQGRCSIPNDPWVKEAIEKRDEYTAQLKQDKLKPSDPTTITDLRNQHREAMKEVNRRKQYTRRKLEQKELNEYHSASDFIDIENQLDGIAPDPILRPQINYEIKERGLAAKLFFVPLSELYEFEIFQLRSDLSRVLAALCKYRETPARWKGRPRITKVHQEEEHAKRKGEGTGTDCRPTTLFCPFCRWSPDVIPEGQRMCLWPRSDTLAKHINDQHFLHKSFLSVCPFPDCTVTCHNLSHLLAHLERTHMLHFPPSPFRELLKRE